MPFQLDVNQGVIVESYYARDYPSLVHLWHRVGGTGLPPDPGQSLSIGHGHVATVQQLPDDMTESRWRNFQATDFLAYHSLPED